MGLLFVTCFIIFPLLVPSFVSGNPHLCNKNEFSCSQGGCVAGSKRCDGSQDCPDGSDELNCLSKSNRCKSNDFFPCSNGECVSIRYKCDGTNDCADGSDEQKCHLLPSSAMNISCPQEQFLCDGICLPNLYRCDGTKDCVDGADEIDCDLLKKNCTGFFCGTKCLSKGQVCDGTVQCPDESDEADCGPEPSSCLLEAGWFLCPGTTRCLNLTQTCNHEADCSRGEDESDLCGVMCSTRKSPCSHKCAATPQGPHCLCPPGFRLDRDNSTCTNINECSLEPPVCSQKCVDLAGSYACVCDPGYVLQDRHSCLSNGTEGVLLISSPPEFHSYNIHSQQYIRMQDLPPLNILSFDFDYVDGQVYWVNVENEEGSQVAVYRSRMRSQEKEVVIHADFHAIRGVALDWVGRHLYLTYTNPGRVVICDLQGYLCTVLLQGLDKPAAIVLDPEDKLMYWVDGGIHPYIGMAGMDGSGPHPFVNEHIAHPTGLALDRPGLRLYWADSFFSHIAVINLDGTQRRVLPVYVAHPTSLDVWEDWLFWTDIGNREVGRCDKLTGHNHTTLARSAHMTPLALKLKHSLKQPMIHGPCLEANCSHMCVLSPVLPYRCLCPLGMELLYDQHTCQDSFKTPWLIVNRANRLLQIHPDRLGRTSVKTIRIKSSRRIGAMAFHPALNSVVYSDLASKSLYAFNMATHIESILWNRSIDAIEGLVIDPFSGLMYWTDAGRQTMECGDPIEKTRAVLSEEIHHPTSLVVAYQKGIAFVVENGVVSQKHGMLFSIVRVNLTDLTVRVFVPFVNGPGTVLAYDHVTDYLYWSDPNFGTIERGKWDESDHQIVRAHLGYPNYLTIMGPTLFWAERLQSNHLQAVNTVGLQPERPLHIGPPSNDDIRHLVVLHVPEVRDQTHACGITNGGCDQICLPTGSGRRCICEVGFGLENSTHCVRRTSCLENEWQCGNSNCISKSKRCDGIPDCLPNGDDEINCVTTSPPFVPCALYKFRCQDNTCIRDQYECDGEADCPDGSDEHSDCPAVFCNSANEIICQDHKRCYLKSQKCDDVRNCADGSDEQNCPQTCTSIQYRCEGEDTKCISLTWVCDGLGDCPKGDDESECNITSPLKVSVTCPEGQSACNNGYCLPSSYFCDGERSCPDNSDEDFCDNNIPNYSNRPLSIDCPSGTISCYLSTGQCISAKAKCNCVQECEGGEDEIGCPACENRFRCQEDDSILIPRSQVCDGEKDCPSGSDESSCGQMGENIPAEPVANLTQCGDSYTCKSGECVDWSMVCDKYIHCSDTTDEDLQCGTACLDSSVCLKHEVCQPTPYGPVCFCSRGYRKVNGHCEDIDECTESQPCSHNCLNVKGGYKCSCAVGFTLHLDKKSCKLDGDKPLLLLATAHDVQLSSIASLDSLSTMSQLPAAGIQAMDFNVRTRTLVFATDKGDLYTTQLSSTNAWSTLVHLGSSEGYYPSSLVWNWNANYIYLVLQNTTQDTSDIIVWSLALKQQFPLVRRQGIITDIAVDPTRHLVIWAEISLTSQNDPAGAIVSSFLNATHPVVLVQRKVVSPKAIALDSVNSAIYWADSHLRHIEVIRYDGKQRHIVVQTLDGYPISLAFFSDMLIWSCSAQEHVHLQSLVPGSNVREIHASKPFRIIRIAHLTLQPLADTDACLEHKCSYFCLPNENGYSCHCPPSFLLATDRQNCIPSPEHSRHGQKAHRINHADVDISDGTGVTVLSIVVCLGVVTALSLAGYFYFKRCKKEVGSPFKLRLRMSPSAPEESVTWEDSVDFSDRSILHRKETLKLEKEKPHEKSKNDGSDLKENGANDVRNRSSSIIANQSVQISPVTFSMRDKLLPAEV